MNFFQLVAQELTGKFAPVTPDVSGFKDKLTVHGAIRTMLGTNPDWSTLAYRNHAEISQFIQSTYQGLSETLGERSDTWCMRSVRTEEEVISLLTKAGDEIQLPVPPVPQVRPGMKKISGAGKYRGVIPAEIAALARQTSRGFADVLGEFLRPQISDLEMLDAIDRRASESTDESSINWSLSRLFSTTVPIWLRTSETTLISDFCFSIYDEWSGVRDEDLTSKLQLIVEESKRSKPIKPMLTLPEVNHSQIPAEVPLRTFVALDFETTGVNPYKDRVIEIGCVKFDSNFREIGRFETLVNPKRDVGRTDIHGITPSHLRDAPSFSDISKELCEFLHNSVLVAHNKSFDFRFLKHELERLDIFPSNLDGLCTMELMRIGTANPPRKLTQCCEFLGIEIENAHQAVSDAFMSSQIAIRILRETGYPAIPDPVQILNDDFPPRTKDLLTRSMTLLPSPNVPNYLSTLIEKLPNDAVLGGRHAIASAEYLNLLDLVLADRLIDQNEAEDLHGLAEILGLSFDNVQILHSSYLYSLCNSAIADGVITEEEKFDIQNVAKLLDINEWQEFFVKPENSAASLRTTGERSELGSSVCFTGTMSISREKIEELARSKGFEVLPRVTKLLDILVVADPHSESAKAKKARSYGTRIIAESAFRKLL